MAVPKVVIVGGGFGGLNAALALANHPFDVWVIDKKNHHLFQPLLYQVATAALSPADIATPIREVLRDYENITVLMGEIQKIDTEKKCLVFSNKETIFYDFLILAPGAKHSYFGKQEWEKHAPGIKTLLDALQIREKILLSFEKAERCDVISEVQKYLNFAIIGGGPTGVELAGAIAEIAYQTMLKNFRRIKTSKAKIYLIEATEEVLPSFPKKLRKKAHQYLEEFGVEVILGDLVTEITDQGLQVGKTFIQSSNVIWAAGNQAAHFLQTLNSPQDKMGRVYVKKDLSIEGHPEIFVIGDAAHCLDKNKKPLPGIAPVAVQQGRYVAKMLRKKIPPGKRPRFRYFDKGNLATIGTKKAVGSYKKFTFSGFIAWFTWAFVHIMYLVNFRNRLVVFTQWMFSYFTGQKGARLINRGIDGDTNKSS